MADNLPQHAETVRGDALSLAVDIAWEMGRKALDLWGFEYFGESDRALIRYLRRKP